jgi:acyl-CoA thioester hydrolase
MTSPTTLHGDGAVELPLRIRWRDLDPLGHVNTAVYLTYLEEARDHWLATTLGADFAPENYVVVRVELNFRAEIRRATEVIGSCRPVAVGRTSITTREELRRSSDGQLLAEATVVIALWNSVTRTSRAVTDEERAALLIGDIA